MQKKNNKRDEKSPHELLDDALGDPNFAAEVVQELIEGKFLLDDERNVYYEVTDVDAQVARPIPYRSLKDVLERLIDSELAKWAREHVKIDYTPEPKTLSMMVGIAKRRCERIPEVVGCRPKWEPGYCLHRCMIEPDPTVPTPLYDAFFKRHTDGEWIMAWYWGIYSGEYCGRQNPYSDSDGDTGRTSSFRVINDALFGRGKGYAAVSVKKSKIDSQFFYSNVDGKKLLIVGECSNPNWPLDSVYKEISGGDIVDVERKGVDGESKRVKAGIITLANNTPPNLRNERAILSRTVPMMVAPFSEKDGEKVGAVDPLLEAELPGLLAKMKAAWLKRSENNGEYIRTNDAVTELVSELVEDGSEQWCAFIDRYFDRDPEGVVSGAELRRAFDAHFGGKRVYNDLSGWMKQQPEFLMYRNNGTKYSGLRFKTTMVAIDGYQNEPDSKKRGRMIRAQIEQMEGS